MKRNIMAVAVAVIFGVLTSYGAYFTGLHNGYLQRRQHEMERVVQTTSDSTYRSLPSKKPT